MTPPFRVRMFRSRAARHVHVHVQLPEGLRSAWCRLSYGHDPVDAGDEIRCRRCPRTWRRGS